MPLARDPKAFVRRATAMIDISDGLFLDLSRLCDESRVGAVVYEDRVPLSDEMIKAASYLGVDPFTLASEGGRTLEGSADLGMVVLVTVGTLAALAVVMSLGYLYRRERALDWEFQKPDATDDHH